MKFKNVYTGVENFLELPVSQQTQSRLLPMIKIYVTVMV